MQGGRRFLGITFPPLKQFGPVVVIWGLAMATLDRAQRHRLVGDVLRRAAGDAVRRDQPLVVRGDRSASPRRSASGTWERTSPTSTPASRPGCTRSTPSSTTRRSAATRSPTRCSPRPPAGCSARASGRRALTLPAGGPLLPAPQTDMIYAVITDELGLFGAVAVLITYLLFVARGFKTAMLARDSFSTLLAVGLSAMFALQVFVIVGGVTRVIPLTGVTLPFISYGGSSIVANFVLVALLLLVSDRARRPRVNAPIARAVRRGHSAVRAAGRLHLALDRVPGVLAQQQPAQRAHVCSTSSRSSADGSWRPTAPCSPSRCRAAGDTWSRTYPTGRLFSQPVGFSIAAKGEAAGLEQSAGPDLRGVQTGLSSIFGQLSPRPVGDDVYTTLDPKGQRRRRARRWPGWAGLGRRARSEHGRGQGHVLQPRLRRQQPADQGQHDGHDVQPRDPGRLRSGLDVQDRHRDGGDRQLACTRRTR